MNLPPGAENLTNRLGRIAFGLAVCASLAIGGPVAAQEDPPASDPPAAIQVATEAPPPQTVLPPPPPTDPPPPPTAIPVEPTAAPTDVLAQPTEAPAEPTAPPTGIPATPPTTEPTATPTPTESPTPSPTATPAPELTYALANEPTCSLAPDQPPAIASGGSLNYTCVSQLALNGTHIAPANVTVAWSAQASVNGGWSVQVLPPVNSAADVVEWTAAGQPEARFAFDQRNPAGAGVAPISIETTTQIDYRLRVQRLACAVDTQAIEVRHNVSVQSPDAVAAPRVSPFDFTNPEPLRLTPNIAPIPDPAVAFGGALNFGEVGVTANGPDAAVKHGTLDLVVTNLDQTCGEWTLQVAATALTGADGEPLSGAMLVVVSIDGHALPDDGCDLANGCDLATLIGNPSTTSTMTYSIEVELRVPEQPDLGAFQTSLTAALHVAAVD